MAEQRLTARQQDILSFIEAEVSRRGMPPTVREIAAHFNIASPNGVWCHLKALEEKGYLKKEPGRSRGTAPVSPVSGGRGAVNLAHPYPLVGEVAAGGPKLAIQTDEGSLTLDEAAGARPGDFLLKVKGDSMIGAGINPGDLAVVRPAHEAHNGEITVVMVGDEEATLKRYFTDKNGWIRLVPENPDYRPIVIKPGGPTVRIIGKVVGVLRKY
jgi:repressor LexA